VIHPSSTVRWLAESVRGMLGYEPEGLIGTHLSELVHPEDAHRAMRFLSHAVANEGRPEILALRLRAADGAYRHLELIADNRLADPVIDGILLNLRDVSERLELEEQLRHQAFHEASPGSPTARCSRIASRRRSYAPAGRTGSSRSCSSTSTTSRPSTTASTTPWATSC